MTLGAHRKQALFTITVDKIVVQENKIVFLPNKTLKHTNTCTPFTTDKLQITNTVL